MRPCVLGSYVCGIWPQLSEGGGAVATKRRNFEWIPVYARSPFQKPIGKLQ